MFWRVISTSSLAVRAGCTADTMPLNPNIYFTLPLCVGLSCQPPIFACSLKLHSRCQLSVILSDRLCRCTGSALQHLDDILAIPACQPSGMTHRRPLPIIHSMSQDAQE